MGRGRGKGKKQSLLGAGDDGESGEDEKLPVKRRGRPQKPLKDEIEEEDEAEKIEENEDGNDTKNPVLSLSTTTENGRKRKRASSQVKEIADSVKVENGKTNANTDFIKSVGYRHIGSRRKNKPRRAAEVGCECK